VTNEIREQIERCRESRTDPALWPPDTDELADTMEKMLAVVEAGRDIQDLTLPDWKELPEWKRFNDALAALDFTDD